MAKYVIKFTDGKRDIEIKGQSMRDASSALKYLFENVVSKNLGAELKNYIDDMIKHTTSRAESKEYARGLRLLKAYRKERFGE